MDAQSRGRDVALLGALIQSLACLELEGRPSSEVPSAEVRAKNRFLAARDGMEAQLIDSEGRCLIPGRERLDCLLADCRPFALGLGCAGALDRMPRLAAANGGELQHVLVACRGRLDELVKALADHFCWTVLARRRRGEKRPHI